MNNTTRNNFAQHTLYEVIRFRVMPNTAISIQESMTCIAGNGNTKDCLDTVKELFDQLGQTVIITEELMGAATVLASCGTAFALRYVRAAMRNNFVQHTLYEVIRVDQISWLHKKGIEVILVSSGAVAAGRSLLNLSKKLDMVSSRQLYSAVGQVKLINRYADLFRDQGIICAQVLTTKDNS